MNELEQKMADILTELKVDFISQFEEGEISYSAKCNSKFGCSYQDTMGAVFDEEKGREVDIECTQDPDYAEDCKWYVPEKSYPKFILDFAIIINDKKVCIECDGFHFHHASKNQENNDAYRDSWLRDNGWIVKRFDGITITSHKSRVKKELGELFDTLKPITHEQKKLF